MLRLSKADLRLYEHQILSITTTMATAIPPRGRDVIACAWVMFAIATIVVCLRLYVRLKMIHIFGREDIMIVLALVSLTKKQKESYF